MRKGNLSAARAVLGKIFKDDEDSVVTIDESRYKKSHPFLSTGSVIIDFLIGGIPNRYGVLPCPGLPRGRLVNIWGAESSGKTTLCLTAAAETCRRGGEVCYIDWEHALDIPYAKALGVPIDDPEAFLLIQPETLEKGLSYLWAMAKGGVDLIVVDSVVSAATKQEWERSIEEQGDMGRVGIKAAQWSRILAPLKALISRTNSCVIGISQLRKKIETGYGHKQMGDGTTPQGGEAWKFYSELRLGLKCVKTEKGSVRNRLTHKMEDMAVGNTVNVRVHKCKVAASQGRNGDIHIQYGEGIDNLRSVIEVATGYGLVRKASGGRYSWEREGGENLAGHGMDAFKGEIIKTPGAWDELLKRTLAKLAQADVAAVVDPEDGDIADVEAVLGVDQDTLKEVQGILQGMGPVSISAEEATDNMGEDE